MSDPIAPGLRWAILSVAGAALALPSLIVADPPAIPPAQAKLRQIRRTHVVVPPTVLPPVEPVAFVALAPDDARAFNAGVPFSDAPNPAARPFRLRDAPGDLARATDCLATAVLYEAGADRAGQRAVAQVVLNRVRHPAFPKTVCGVVFEGQERSTGCQFSFTCDGALTRWTPPDALWAGARKVATDALAGAVYRPVGYATHYHTDWVVPYWQSSLDKIAKVGTHLFFRWTGWWGTPPAFNRAAAATEPVIAKIAAISDAHRTGAALAEADAALAETAALTGGAPQPVAGDPDSFLVTLPAGLGPDAWPALAAQACGDRPACRFTAWSDAGRTPKALPLSPEQVATSTFSYLRDRATGLERTLWNCRQVKRVLPRECMRQQVLLSPVPVGYSLSPGSAASPAPAASPTPQRYPIVLDGVRRGRATLTLRPVPAAAPAEPRPRPGAEPPAKGDAE